MGGLFQRAAMQRHQALVAAHMGALVDGQGEMAIAEQRAGTQALGEPRDAASRIAGTIADWRDPDALTQPAGGAEDADYSAAGLAWGAKDAPFETVTELQQVLGMRPALFAAAAPYLTVYSGSAMPDAYSADDLVLRAMGVERPEPLDPDAVPLAGSGTYSIDSRARLADGRRAHVSVILRLGGNGLPGSAYTPLRWQDGATP